MCVFWHRKSPTQHNNIFFKKSINIITYLYHLINVSAILYFIRNILIFWIIFFKIYSIFFYVVVINEFLVLTTFINRAENFWAYSNISKHSQLFSTATGTPTSYIQMKQNLMKNNFIQPVTAISAPLNAIRLFLEKDRGVFSTPGFSIKINKEINCHHHGWRSW